MIIGEWRKKILRDGITNEAVLGGARRRGDARSHATINHQSVYNIHSINLICRHQQRYNTVVFFLRIRKQHDRRRRWISLGAAAAMPWGTYYIKSISHINARAPDDNIFKWMLFWWLPCVGGYVYVCSFHARLWQPPPSQARHSEKKKERAAHASAHQRFERAGACAHATPISLTYNSFARVR